MTLAQTFQAVEETRFLSRLSLEEQLLFIGEPEPLDYIQSFLSQSQAIDSNSYLPTSENNLAKLAIFLPDWHQYQAIIVVSWQQENELLLEIKKYLITWQIPLPVIRLFADSFINLICQRRLLQGASDTLIKPKISYAIMTTPRSGSTHFCDLLDSSKIAGYPAEHLRLATQELAKNCNFDYLRLLSNLMQYRITENGVFGTKFISHFLFELQQTKFDFRQIFKSIDKFILLIRKDKVAQAVSLLIAQKTEVWHIQNQSNQDHVNYQFYQSQLESIQINDDLLAEVAHKHQFINNQEKRLRKILQNNQINPLEIYYEDIVADPQMEINRVLDFLEILPSSGYTIELNSKIKKMSAKISQEIIRQYQQKNSASLQ